MASTATHASSSQPRNLHHAPPQPIHRPFSDMIANEASSAENLLEETVEGDDCESLHDEAVTAKRSGTLRRRRDKDSRRSRRSKTPREWKKILWVKQSCKLLFCYLM